MLHFLQNDGIFGGGEISESLMMVQTLLVDKPSFDKIISKTNEEGL